MEWESSILTRDSLYERISADGIHWSSKGLSSDLISHIVWNGKFFLESGQANFYISKDGVHWLGYEPKDRQGHSLSGIGLGHSLVWTGDTFLASTHERLYSSTDGITWSREFYNGSEKSN